MTSRLVWVPFPTQRLDPLPDGLQIEEFSGGSLPDSAGQVQLFVSPYDTSLDLSELLPRLPRLKVLQTQTAGVDNVERHVPASVTLTPLDGATRVGDGTPASCTEAALHAVFAAGGTIAFNCGAVPTPG